MTSRATRSDQCSSITPGLTYSQAIPEYEKLKCRIEELVMSSRSSGMNAQGTWSVVINYVRSWFMSRAIPVCRFLLWI
ncbi:hypothetical protein P364_0128600 [Paenibacillus sp. MAEPY2]|nr:hypothetical protein P363_0132680 [Paenibacillus sp. MAEPY1]KGP78406.1 hypothetical protein P364_0128600 [Paenibacillus sp. MAEPY2]